MAADVVLAKVVPVDRVALGALGGDGVLAVGQSGEAVVDAGGLVSAPVCACPGCGYGSWSPSSAA
jgi:hypothetical protein